MTIVITSFVVSLLALLVLLKTNLVKVAMDVPNHRSLHTTLTPRTGGLAIVLSILVVFALLGNLWLWMGLVLGLLIISILDDIYNLPASWRFLAQSFISLLFVSFFLPSLLWYWQVVAVLSLVWMTNLYNFMDGSDGLAGGMALFGFGAYAIAAYVNGDIQLSILCAGISVPCFAFLLFNFYPAKIFMGDSGSIPLGFLAGAMGLYGWHQQVWFLWFPVLVFSPFIADATVTLFKRALRREKVWQAHKEHYYQHLVQMGWGHKKTAIVEYCLMAGVATCALLMLNLTNFWVILLLLVWVVIYLSLMIKIDKKWHQQPR